MSCARMKLVGCRFGRLLVVGPYGVNEQHSSMWKCKCDCGKITICKGWHLKKGATKSCGCLRVEMKLSHGLATTYFRTIWHNLLRRCFNPRSKDYKHYGERGIFPCSGIKSTPRAILDAIGERPHKSLTLDRIDNDSGYHCGQCDECYEKGWDCNLRWATRSQQSLNQRRSRK